MSLARPRTYQALTGQFTPKSIPGCMLWIDAQFGLFQERAAPSTPSVADTDVVGTWLDRSGMQAHGVAPSDAGRPILKLGVIGGLNAVRYDASNDTITHASSPAVNLNEGLTIAYVFNRRGASSFPTLGTVNSGSSSRARVFYLNSASSYSIRFGTTSSELSTGVDATQDVTYYVLGTMASSGLASAWVNGVFRVEGTVTMLPVQATVLTSGATTFNGDIAESVVYNRVLTEIERRRLDRYLMKKYSI